MHMQDEELLFEVVPGGNLHKDVRKLRELCDVAGLLVNLTVKDGATFLSVGYNGEFTEFIRHRNAGRPRKKGEVRISCGKVFSLKEKEGATVAAATVGMSMATFYRRCNENKHKREEDPFV